jgi:hypothetical protein
MSQARLLLASDMLRLPPRTKGGRLREVFHIRKGDEPYKGGRLREVFHIRKVFHIREVKRGVPYKEGVPYKGGRLREVFHLEAQTRRGRTRERMGAAILGRARADGASIRWYPDCALCSLCSASNHAPGAAVGRL